MRPHFLASLLIISTTVSAQRSIWDIILGFNRVIDSTESRGNNRAFDSTVQNRVTETRQKNSFKAAEKIDPVFYAAETTSTSTSTTTTTTTTTARPQTTRGRRKIIVNLMDVYHCPTTGVFPLDGDCERFLMCRQGRQGRKMGGMGGTIRGKVYKCPPGYLFSNSKARCKPESQVACHRSSPLQDFRKVHATTKFFLMP